jgi:hypothetical protein
MPNYMLLIYSPTERPPADDPGLRIEAWQAFTQSLQEAGVFVGADRLAEPSSATTVRVRNGETEITDGPFAVTKEFLGGYYILDCPDLDAALAHAARVPLIQYGTVEVRPIMEADAPATAGQAAAQT